MMIQKVDKYKIIGIVFVLVIGTVVFWVFHKLLLEDQIIVSGHKVYVEIVDKVEKQKKGLGGRSKLCKDCGMLFVFDSLDRYSFWMKDMQFDIDIVWIRDGQVVDLSRNVSHKTPNKVIKSGEDVDSVLEIRSGKIEEFAIIVGSDIKYIKQ